MKKIYELNLDNIKNPDYNMYQAIQQFIKDNHNLRVKFQEYLKNKTKEFIFIKYNNKYYTIKQSKTETEDCTVYCLDCDFEHYCNRMSLCICEELFENDTKIILKELELYEIEFGDNNYEENL